MSVTIYLLPQETKKIYIHEYEQQLNLTDLPLFICFTDNIFIFRAWICLLICSIDVNYSFYHSSQPRTQYVPETPPTTGCTVNTSMSQGVPGPSSYFFSTPPTGVPSIPSRRDYVNVGLLRLWFDSGWTSLTRHEINTFYRTQTCHLKTKLTTATLFSVLLYFGFYTL